MLVRVVSENNYNMGALVGRDRAEERGTLGRGEHWDGGTVGGGERESGKEGPPYPDTNGPTVSFKHTSLNSITHSLGPDYTVSVQLINVHIHCIVSVC